MTAYLRLVNLHRQFLYVMLLVLLLLEDNLLEIDLSKSNSGRWKKDYSVEEQRSVIPLLAEHIKSFGYE